MKQEEDELEIIELRSSPQDRDRQEVDRGRAGTHRPGRSIDDADEREVEMSLLTRRAPTVAARSPAQPAAVASLSRYVSVSSDS